MKRGITPEPSRTRKAPPLHRAGELVYRYGIYAFVAVALAFSAGRALIPTDIFASEGERVKFLATIGEPESTRIIALVTDWCPACRSLESDLNDRHITYARLDIENNPHGRELFKRVSAATGSNTIPKVILDRNVVARGQLLFLNRE